MDQKCYTHRSNLTYFIGQVVKKINTMDTYRRKANSKRTSRRARVSDTSVRKSFLASNDTNDASARKHRPDYSLLVYMALLLGIGAVTVYAISPGVTASLGLESSYFSSRQIIFIFLGIIAFIIASLFNVTIWKKLEVPLLILAGAVSFAVRFFSEPINGAYRWLEIGGITLQAAELIKFALIIWLASYLSRALMTEKITHPDTLKKLGIAVFVVGFVVAGLQSDLGSAAVMMAIIGFMAFVAGLPLKKLAMVGGVILILSTLAIVSSPYRRERVSTFLNPTADCQNEGFQACQALIAVGSGGMFGKGLGRSIQAYGYLPEAANDSIFAIVAEKFGFIGTTIMIGLFVGLFRRIKRVAEQAPDEYSRLLVSGILAWLSVQMMINIGAMIGLLPLKGITLPLVSYGGTSIIFVMAAIGIVFHVSRYTDASRATTVKNHTSQPRSGRNIRGASRSWKRA
jgi:cell division protein FtsW